MGLLLPMGALLGTLASGLPHSVITGLFAFALVALLYLVTEELLVEAHEAPEGPVVTSMFFIASWRCSPWRNCCQSDDPHPCLTVTKRDTFF